jgi:hypothetical protein
MLSRNIRNKELSDIEETQREDRTKETGDAIDNTLIKYFFPEEKNEKKNVTKEKKLAPVKLEKMFKKPIKLRNALKQCYWERNLQVLFFILRIYLDLM